MHRTLCASLLLIASATAVEAQAWKEIGKIATGAMVSVNPKSVKRLKDNLVTASVRVVFAEPMNTPAGMRASTSMTATFDCAKKTFAVKEVVNYSDPKSKKVLDRQVNKMPGYGVALDGSFAALAMNYLCSAPARK